MLFLKNMKIFYFIIINLILSQNLLAYLDPFSSSILVQIIAAVVTFIVVFFKKVKIKTIEFVKLIKLKINKYKNNVKND